jgi:Xaa-Pro dipeptidase
MINWDIRADMAYPARHPTFRVVEKGDYCNNETEAKFNGYIHQTNHALYVGKAPDNYRKAWDCCHEGFLRSCEVAKPGNSIGDMVRATEAVFDKYGLKGHLQLHGRGLGEDRPLLSRGSVEENNRILLQEGNVFIIKPGMTDRGASGYDFRMTVGDTCVVASTGARRLSAHDMELTQVEC